MKIETPQILWHNGSEGNGKPAPLYTVSLLPKIYMNTNNDAKSQTHGSQDEKAKRSIDMGMNANANANANANHQNQDQDDTEILATAGNSNEIHLWKIQLTAQHSNDTSKADLTATSTSKNHEGDEDQDEDEPPAKKPKIFSVASPGIRHITTLTRHQQSINTVAFSPNGHHLASAGDGGTLILHTISSKYRTLQPAAANENKQAAATALTSHKFWNEELQSEKDLSIKIVHTGAEDVMDLSWSQDSTRFMIGTLDHSVLVFEEVQAQVQVPCHDHDRERQSQTINIETKKWNCVWKNTKEHTHYVQGVAFDPLGVYMASQGSDRSVRVWARKGNAKHSSSTSSSSALSSSSTSLATVNGNGNGEAKKVLGDQDKNIDSNVKESTNATQITSVNGMTTHTQTNRSGNIRMTTARDVERHLGGKFDVGKAKVLKYRNLPTNSSNHTNTSANANASEENEIANNQAVKKRHFFADESTVESFFRRLAWSSDGAFLITPASLWDSSGDVTDASGSASASGPSFATYLFARHQYDRPYKVLHGLEKPSVVIRSNPVLFQLPRQVQSDLKENMDDNHYVHASPSSVASNDMRWNVHSHSKIPYRSIFAVLTVDSILIYDTFHSKPLCIARGLHYAGLTDCSWSSDGHNLVVSSTDGYISMISFAKGELGEVYEAHKEIEVSSSCEVHDLKSSISAEAAVMRGIPLSQSQMPPKVKATLPPCEPGQSAVLVGPPAKKARTIVSENVMQVRKKVAKRVTPILIANGHPVDKGVIGMGDEEGKEASEVVGGVTKLSLENSVQ